MEKKVNYNEKKTIEFDINLHKKIIVDYDIDVAHANFAMKRLNDPNRNDNRHVLKTGTSETYDDKNENERKTKKVKK